MSVGLRTRPTAETFPLDDLVERAREGRIRVPRFQRGLRWTRRDVVQLFDSVLKGYPVGSLLFWERDAPEETVTLGPITIDAPAGPAFYVVDGQQRITALAAGLSSMSEQDARFQVGYDLEAREFVGRPPHTTDSYVPAHVLFDLSLLLAWFQDRPDLADSFEDAAAVAKTLRDLRIPAYVVRQDDEEVLRSIFDRMNNAGKKLTRGEVFAALHRPSNHAGEITLRSVAESLEARTGFGLLDDSITMQVILARRGADVMREIRNEFQQNARGRDAFAAKESEVDAYRLGTEAVVGAVEFAQQVAEVPHVAFLPYQYLLITLTRFFAHHPAPSARHQRLLRRFFWRAAVAGPTLGRGNTTGVSRTLNQCVVPDDEAASVAALVSAVSGAPRPGYPGTNPFRTNSAASKTLLCAVWAYGPRSLSTGERIEGEELRTALADRQTAVDLVVPLAARRWAVDHLYEAGNRFLLVSAEDRESEVLAALTTAQAAVLASHLIEADEVGALQGAGAPAAIARRNDRLEHLQTSFLDQMCEWEQEDTPDLAALTAADATDVAD